MPRPQGVPLLPVRWQSPAPAHFVDGRPQGEDVAFRQVLRSVLEELSGHVAGVAFNQAVAQTVAAVDGGDQAEVPQLIHTRLDKDVARLGKREYEGAKEGKGGK